MHTHTQQRSTHAHTHTQIAHTENKISTHAHKEDYTCAYVHKSTQFTQHTNKHTCTHKFTQYTIQK